MLDKKLLDKMKNKLIEEKKRLEKELGGFTNQNVHNKDDYKAKFPNFGDETDENAKEVQEFEENLNMENTLEKELRDVNNALKRIEDGTYGVCYSCKQEIPEGRLEARPTASTCVKCREGFKNK